MKKFKVYLTCQEDPYVEVEAKNQEDALDKVAELYDEQDSQCFTYGGYFSPSEVIPVQ